MAKTSVSGHMALHPGRTDSGIVRGFEPTSPSLTTYTHPEACFSAIPGPTLGSGEEGT